LVINERIEPALECVQVGVDGDASVIQSQVQRLPVPARRYLESMHGAVADGQARHADFPEGPQIYSRMVVPLTVLAETGAEEPLTMQRPEVYFSISA